MLSENFTYNGITSQSKGVKIIRVSSSGFLKEKIIGDANITEIDMPGDYRPLLQRIQRSPFDFTLQIALLDSTNEPEQWTEQKRRDIFSWLFQSEYKPLIFADRPQVRYNVIAQSGLELNTMNERGYVEIAFRTDGPFAYSNVSPISITHSTSGAKSQLFTIDAGAAIDKIYPRVELTRQSASAATVRPYMEHQGPAATIGVADSLISGATKVIFNSKNRTVVNQLNQSLYRFKGTTGFDFIYFQKGSNRIFIPQGWSAVITYEVPILF